MSAYSADFETTTDVNDCRVWAYAVCEVEDSNQFYYGNSLDGFMEFMEEHPGDYYFHNLKFDGEFIIGWLLNHGWEHSKEKAEKTFSTLISKTGQFYLIEIIYKLWNKKQKKVRIYDSLKRLPFSVAQIAKAFELPISKLEIDYKAYRKPGHVLTQQEIDYIRNDVTIVAQALAIQNKQGLTKMTAGSNALTKFIETLGKERYREVFPVLDLEMDTALRPAYRGGWTYCNPLFAGKDVDQGLVFDVNSMYPWAMREKPLPCGRPMYFKGKYKDDSLYPLYIQNIIVEFRLKEHHHPMIQDKYGGYFKANEYLTHSEGEMKLSLSSVDLKLFLDQYDILYIEYVDGYKFKQCTGIFDQYIDYWMEVKMNSTGAIKQLAKLMLNSLYGKFATRPDVTGKIPYLNESGKVCYKLGDQEFREPVYTPLGIFITAWARDNIVRTAQSVYDRFCYADTDSIHIIGKELPNIKIDDKKLGYWKCESHFDKARFIRQKTYIELELTNNPLKDSEKVVIDEQTYRKNVKCAGMPDAVKEVVTWDNFHVGLMVQQGKLRPLHVKGGIVLVDTPYTLR